MATDPYSVKEIMDKVGGSVSRFFSGPTSNYVKRKDKEKEESKNPNADSGRAAATARAIGSAIGSTVGSVATGAIGDDEKRKKGGVSSSLLGGFVAKDGGDTSNVEPVDQRLANSELLKAQLYKQSKENRAAINEARSDSSSDLMKQANKVIADMDARKLKADLEGQATSLAGGVTAKPFTFDSAVDDVMAPAGKIKAEPLETTGAYNDAMANFKQNFPSKNGSLIMNEGETGDEYTARLKERNAARSQVRDLAPISVAEAPSRTGMAETSADASSPSSTPTPRAPRYGVIREAPSSRVRNTANRMSESDRLKGRQAFGDYLGKKLDQGGGYYEFSKDDDRRARELGIGDRELGNFTRRRERQRQNQFGARGGLS